MPITYGKEIIVFDIDLDNIVKMFAEAFPSEPTLADYIRSDQVDEAEDLLDKKEEELGGFDDAQQAAVEAWIGFRC